MPLFDKLQYLQLMNGPGQPITPAAGDVSAVLDYAAGVWAELELKPRKLKPGDVTAVSRHGDRMFFHVKVFPRRMPDTFVIVVTKPGEDIEGHILIDLAAEYSEPVLDCPSSDFEGVAGPGDIEKLIPQIHPDDDNPFAILTVGEGTYMQTLRLEEGFVLEHQLVNPSSHYEIPEPASAEQVVAAMLSYAFGKNEWLESFAWQRQELE